MAEAQAAAPAPAAAPATPAAKAPAAPAAVAKPPAPKTSSIAPPPPITEAAKPNAAPLKRGESKHDAIRAKLAASTSTETPEGEKPADPKPDETPKPETEKPKPAVGAVMRLTAENTKLTNQLEELRGKYEAASTGETVESLRERVRKDPAVLLEVFGDDIDKDEAARLAKLNDAVLDRSDPANAKDRERDARVAKLEKDLSEANSREQTFAARERDTNARAHTAKVLTEGHTADDGTVLIDPAKFPYVNHLTKTGEVDAHAGVMQTTRELAADFRKEQKREPTEAEIVTMIGIAAGQAEAYFSKRAKNWSLPAAPQAEEPAPDIRPVPKTIGSQMGRRSPGLVDATHLSKTERHEAIRQRLRSSLNQTAN